MTLAQQTERDIHEMGVVGHTVQTDGVDLNNFTFVCHNEFFFFDEMIINCFLFFVPLFVLAFPEPRESLPPFVLTFPEPLNLTHVMFWRFPNLGT